MNPFCLIILLGWAGLFLAPAVHAFPSTSAASNAPSSSAPTDPLSVVIRDYQRANDLYDQQKYQPALQLFLQVFRSLPAGAQYAYTRKELRFFIGRCYFRLGRYRRAEQMLKRYLQEGARQEATPEVRRMLQLIEQRLAPIERVITPITSPRPPASSYSRRLGAWVLLGTGGAMLVSAVLCGVFAQNAFEQSHQQYLALKNQPNWPASPISIPYQQGQTLAISADILYAGSGVVLVAGLIMLLVSL